MTQELKQALKPDICVIGAGAAGRAAASAAAAFGVPVVLIEKGTLGNGGGVPTTALAVTAERANIIRNAAHFGLKAAALRRRFRGGEGASARRRQYRRAD